MSTRPLVSLACLFYSLTACGPELPSGPSPIDGDFGKGDSPYADSAFHDCVRARALTLVNDPAVEAPQLIAAGMTADAAARVVAHADRFATIQALESLAGVGLENVRSLLLAMADVCRGEPFGRACAIGTDDDGDGAANAETISTYDDWGRTTRKERRVDGRIVRLFLRTYDTNGHYIRYEQHRPDGDGELAPQHIIENTYDDRGRLIRQLEDKSGDGNWQIEHRWTYGADANPLTYTGGPYGSGRVGTRGDFRYDSSGRIVEELWYPDDNPESEWFQRQTYSYNGAGLIAESLRQERAFGDVYDMLTVYTYSPSGKQLTVEESSDGVLSFGTHYQYDTGGRLIREEQIEGAERTSVLVLTFEYDSSGRELHQHIDGSTEPGSESSADGAVDQTVTTHYDAAGNVAATVRTAASGDVVERTSYDYGCWTER